MRPAGQKAPWIIRSVKYGFRQCPDNRLSSRCLIATQSHFFNTTNQARGAQAIVSREHPLDLCPAQFESSLQKMNMNSNQCRSCRIY
jgi:hypothetical protein